MSSEGILTRKRIVVKGVVQGIGFRPYVYLQAKKRGLNGFVLNTDQGVIIEIEGAGDILDGFLSDLTANPPPLSRIISLEASNIPAQGEEAFHIRESLDGLAPDVSIPPDLALCPDCLMEMQSPADRRFHYPFINCTQCGPRLTIIKKVPYDRQYTSMSPFIMCKECSREFLDPASRRFHAQPNACPVCGPHVWLANADGTPVESCDPIGDLAMFIKQGAIVAIKGLGGFHLAADATNDQTVRELRLRKAREEKPFAVMSLAIEDIRRYALVTDSDCALLEGPVHPICLVPKKASNALSHSVAPGQRYFGVMLPYTPIHFMLLSTGFLALVMTSGNLSEEPIVIKNGEAQDALSGIADYFLFHNREILVRCDDSVVMPVKGRPLLVRRARGYAPIPVCLKKSYPNVLALGGQLKNTLCVLKGNKAYMSQHIGDMDGPGARGFFNECIKRMQEIAGVFPDVVAHDLHPDYTTSRIAEAMEGKRTYAVQHHHAHLAGCMADNGLEGPVIGLIFDGTGYGTDGTIWGGEVLLGDETSFERVAYLEQFPLPGGEAAIRTPWRCAVGVLYKTYGEDWLRVLYSNEIASSQGWQERGDKVRREWQHIPILQGILPKGDLTKNTLSLMCSMMAKGINSPMTSSMGRLFDAVSAMLGFHRRIYYEGQAAIALESLAAMSTDQGAYSFSIDRQGAPWRMEFACIIRAIVDDLIRGIPREVIARRFHNTITRMASEVAVMCSKTKGLDTVVLSGGCFQNRILIEGIIEGLDQRGLKAYPHLQVPTNDGGIALGQAVCAGALHGFQGG